MKFPDPRFDRYGLVLRHDCPELDGQALGKPLTLYRMTEYEPGELLNRGKMRLAVFWRLWRKDRRLEIWGRWADSGEWVPVSPWLVKDWRLATGFRSGEINGTGKVSSDTVGGVVGRVRRVLARYEGRQRPGRGEIAHHLLDHEVRGADETLALFGLLGIEVLRPQLPGLRRNGKDRISKGRECRLCER